MMHSSTTTLAKARGTVLMEPDLLGVDVYT